MKISLCMIVKDEEAVLARCLESVKGLADEIVIVDTGSADGTVKLAKRYANKVDFFPWRDDFSAARNHAFSLASGDYLLWLDADDVLPAQEREKFPALRALLESGRPDAVVCPYETGGVSYLRERFLRREANFTWVGRVHECIALRGKVLRSDLRVLHLRGEKPYTARNLGIYRKWEREEALSPRDLFYYGRELFYHGYYREAEEKLENMLAGDGWYVNKIEACKVLSDCILAEWGAERSLPALFRSFEYGAPRASVLCEIGARFFSLARYREAAFWYRAALLAEDHSAEGDFEQPDCRGIVPLLQLVVCHWRLGEREQARFYHEKTEELAPRHPSVLYNKRFFPGQSSSASASP